MSIPACPTAGLWLLPSILQCQLFRKTGRVQDRRRPRYQHYCTFISENSLWFNTKKESLVSQLGIGCRYSRPAHEKSDLISHQKSLQDAMVCEAAGNR